MSQCETLRITRAELDISKHVSITHLLSPSIFETRHMMIGAVIKLSGLDFMTKTQAVLNSALQNWHRTVAALDDDICLYVTTHRHQIKQGLPGKFKSNFLNELNAKYMSNFNKKACYVNDIYLTVLHRGLGQSQQSGFAKLLTGLSKQDLTKQRDAFREQQRKSLNDIIEQLCYSLSDYKPHLLGGSPVENDFSELLTFLGLFLNANVQIPYKLTYQVPVMAKTHEGLHKAMEQYPFGHIGQYLSAKKICFGDNIQFQGATESDNTFAALLSIKRYPSHSESNCFEAALNFDGEYISTQSFARITKESSLKIIERQATKLKNANDKSLSQLAQLTEARDVVASDELVMGYHHHTLMLLAPSSTELEQVVNKATKMYASAGFAAVRETIGQEPAFWAQIPGNLHYVARSSLITSWNFVHFCPLFNYPQGKYDANFLGGAVTLLTTPGQSPYFFNFHLPNSGTTPSPGHTIMVGGNGSGKTVAMGFFDAQLGRYQGRSVIFDRDRGMEIYTRASGGKYFILSPEHADTIQFNPFMLPNTSANRQFCREWLSQLLLRPHETNLPADILEQVDFCITYAFDKLAKPHRRLSNVSACLGHDFKRWSELRLWLSEGKNNASGPYSYLFDNTHDMLMDWDKVGFDLTHFLDNEAPRVLTPLLMYLFHHIEINLNGELTSLFLDEGWQCLNNDYWKEKLGTWLPTLRKKNCHIVLATQSPSSITHSSIADVILDNCATQIYFVNPQAKRETYQSHLNLTDKEFEFVASGNQTEHYMLVKQQQDSVVCKINMNDLNDILTILSANKRTLTIMDNCIRETSDDPTRWLPLFHERSGGHQ